MVKTWEERLAEVSDESIVTSLAVQFAMQDEIDELRAKLAEYESREPVAWMTADGRVCTANTKLHAMANSSKEAFGVPLYLGAKT